MKDLTLLNPKTGGNLRWAPPADFSFLREFPLLPVQAAEAGRVGSALPLAIVKDDQTPSGWSLVAVCGQTAARNAMISGGKWLAKAVPECVRYLPFSLKDIGGGKGLAAIDKRYSKYVVTDGSDGAPLFDEGGILHPAARKRVEFLQGYQSKIARTQGILSLLKQAGLIVAWPDSALKAGGITLAGLHTVDEKALHGLDDDTFLALRKSGALAVAYGCLLSLYQIRNLTLPASATEQSGSATAVQTTGDLDLEFLNDSETIKFGPLH